MLAKALAAAVCISGAAAQINQHARAAPGPVTTALASSKAGYETYQVSITLTGSGRDFNEGGAMSDVYALFGQAGAPLMVPAAFQAAAPFGVNTGPVNPAFFPILPDCEFDSFLTIGMDGPALSPGAMSTIGIDFAAWTESAGINSDNGAVFFMDPSHGATVEPITVMQLTVPQGAGVRGQFSLQGRSLHGAEDFEAFGLTYDSSGGATPPPPPTSRGPPPPAPPTPAPPVNTVDHCWLPPDYSTTPCQNGATCLSTGGSYICDCPAGFMGLDCESGGAAAPPPPATRPGDTGDHVTPIITTMGASKASYTTYQISVVRTHATPMS